jgi:hypothetical protein
MKEASSSPIKTGTMQTQTFTLDIADIKARNRTPFGPRYAWETGERDEVYLNVTARDEQGNTVYFNTPAVSRTVLSGPGCAVVTYGDENAWLTPPEAYSVTANQQARPGSGVWQHKIAVGQRITVKARLKKTYKNGCYVINYVKLVEVTI